MRSYLTHEEARLIAQEAVKLAFDRMGLDVRNPLETQADMVFLRETRRRCGSMKNRAASWALITLLTSGSLLTWGGLFSRLRGE